MSNDDRSRNLPAGADEAAPNHLTLGPSTQVSLEGLPEPTRQQLLTEYARGMVDLNRRAQELGVDVNALRSTLDTLTDSTRQVADQGNSVTISHTQTSAAGRTEIIMGNTESAGKGKLTKSQTGERDMTPIYVIGGLIALVLIAAAFA